MIDHHKLALDLIAQLRMQPFALTGLLLDPGQVDLKRPARKAARNLANLAAFLTDKSKTDAAAVARVELYTQKPIVLDTAHESPRQLVFLTHADVALDGRLTFAPDGDLTEAMARPCFVKICQPVSPSAETARLHPVEIVEGHFFIEHVAPFFAEALSQDGSPFQGSSHRDSRVFVVPGVKDWSVYEGSHEAPERAPSYDMRITLSDAHVHVDVAPAGAFSQSAFSDLEQLEVQGSQSLAPCLGYRMPHLSVGFEINGDVPCAHVYANESSEMIQSLFGLQDEQVLLRQGDGAQALRHLPDGDDFPKDLTDDAVLRFQERGVLAGLLNMSSEPQLLDLFPLMERFQAGLIDKQIVFRDAKSLLMSLDSKSKSAKDLAGLLELLGEQNLATPVAQRPVGG